MMELESMAQKLIGSNSISERLKELNLVAPKPVELKPDEQKPTEQKPTEQKPIESKDDKHNKLFKKAQLRINRFISKTLNKDFVKNDPVMLHHISELENMKSDINLYVYKNENFEIGKKIEDKIDYIQKLIYVRNSVVYNFKI
jgi:hypothetical protein